MLLELIKEPPTDLPTGLGGGPYKGRKPASEGTGQAEACLARPAIEVLQPGTKKRRLLSYGASAPQTPQVPTPGHGIDRDGRTLARQGAMGKRKKSVAISHKKLVTEGTVD